MTSAGIDLLLSRYQDALNARDLRRFAELHWQDAGFVHTWSPGSVDDGWDAYVTRLTREFDSLPTFAFRLSRRHTEVFGGKHAVVAARWQCEFNDADRSSGSKGGPVTFVLAVLDGTWKIVADHFSEE